MKAQKKKERKVQHKKRGAMSHKSGTAAKKGHSHKVLFAPPKQIGIDNRHGHVPPMVEEIKLTRGQNPALPNEVKWNSTTGSASVVCFCKNGSPFDNWYFVVPADGSYVFSGPVRPDADYRKYQYMVVGEDGFNDPVIIVDQ